MNKSDRDFMGFERIKRGKFDDAEFDEMELRKDKSHKPKRERPEHKRWEEIIEKNK